MARKNSKKLLGDDRFVQYGMMSKRNGISL